MAFEFSEYSKILAYLLSQGYAPTLDWSSFPRESTFILRHDIDVIPDLCFPLADIEEAHDCRSTWFFLEENGIYSVYDSYTTKIVNELRARGHSVQLHLDCSSAKSLDELVSLVDVAVRRWSDHFGYQPACFSFHRPATFNLIPKTVDYRWHNRLRCAYDGDIFYGVPYVSDSNHSKVSTKVVQRRLGERQVASMAALQLLTHPLWWAERELAPAEIRERIYKLIIKRTDSVLRDNIKLFRSAD